MKGTVYLTGFTFNSFLRILLPPNLDKKLLIASHKHEHLSYEARKALAKTVEEALLKLSVKPGRVYVPIQKYDIKDYKEDPKAVRSRYQKMAQTKLKYMMEELEDAAIGIDGKLNYITYRRQSFWKRSPWPLPQTSENWKIYMDHWKSQVKHFRWQVYLQYGKTKSDYVIFPGGKVLRRKDDKE